MVRKHLGPPDALAANPFRGVDRPVRVYLLRRAERAEWRAGVIAGLQRAAGALRLREMIDDGSIELLRDKLADDLAVVPTDVTVIPIEDLRSRAYAALSRARAEQGGEPLGIAESELPATPWRDMLESTWSITPASLSASSTGRSHYKSSIC
jgi:hypothetical protein